jgi:Predicted methyltransferase regulatory domain/Methyltransferase domain
VLELGCGDGANLLSLAQALPGARFLGIDASASAVARGNALARAARLENVELRHGDIERLPAELGSFDYVLAHGVYSWIPPAARGALLACCRERLTPAGIAYVSYNAYPGSYLRDMTRDVLHYHVRDIHEPQARLEQAHELMRAIVAIESPSPYAQALREQLERMLRSSDALLLHDDLAEVSTPFYFHEFIEHATRHGLRFLSEAELADSQMRDVPDSAARLMASLPEDRVVREQYMDFFRNRTFRQTLLCHAHACPHDELDDRQLEGFAISSPARPREEPGEEEAAERDAEQTFTTPAGFSVTTSEPLVKAALRALWQAWPRSVDWGSLLELACAAAGPQAPTELVQGRLREVLLQAHLARIVHLQGCPAPVAAHAAERPLASPLARAQCAAGAQVVSSLLHGNVNLQGELDVGLLVLLDGTRDRTALLSGLAHSPLDADSQSATAELVEATLTRFAGLGLLQAAARS